MFGVVGMYIMLAAVFFLVIGVSFRDSATIRRQRLSEKRSRRLRQRRQQITIVVIASSLVNTIKCLENLVKNQYERSEIIVIGFDSIISQIQREKFSTGKLPLRFLAVAHPDLQACRRAYTRFGKGELVFLCPDTFRVPTDFLQTIHEEFADRSDRNIIKPARYVRELNSLGGVLAAYLYLVINSASKACDAAGCFWITDGVGVIYRSATMHQLNQDAPIAAATADRAWVESAPPRLFEILSKAWRSAFLALQNYTSFDQSKSSLPPEAKSVSLLGITILTMIAPLLIITAQTAIAAHEIIPFVVLIGLILGFVLVSVTDRAGFFRSTMFALILLIPIVIPLAAALALLWFAGILTGLLGRVSLPSYRSQKYAPGVSTKNV